MMEWKQDLAILSDLSANVFAVFVLVLIMLLLQPPEVEDHPRPPPVIEASADLAIVERAPLPAASVVAHLFDRRPQAQGVSIDLFADRVVVVAYGEETLLPVSGDRPLAQRLAGLLQPLPQNAAVRLYVFSNRSYVLVTDVLRNAGRSFSEVSVPQALRGRSGARVADAWSAAFLALVQRPLDPSRFRYALARLLAGAGEGAFEPARTGRAAPSAWNVQSMTERLRHLAASLATIFALVIIVTGFVVVLVIESRWPRSRQIMDRSQRDGARNNRRPGDAPAQ